MAVIVNGERIDPNQIESEVERLRPYYEQYAAGSENAGQQQLREWARENLIERTLVLQAAREMPVAISRPDVDAAYEQIKDDVAGADAEAVKADIEQQIRVERLMDGAAKYVGPPTKKEVEDFYKEHSERFMEPEQVRAGHIVKHVNADTDRKTAFEAMLELKMQLDGGASFEAMATKHSDCPDRGGDVGYFARGQMVQEFEDVAFGLEVGRVSDIFLSSYGYHICKVYDRKPAERISLDQVKDEIEKEIFGRRREEAMEAFVDKLKGEADITEIDD